MYKTVYFSPAVTLLGAFLITFAHRPVRPEFTPAEQCKKAKIVNPGLKYPGSTFGGVL